MSLNREALLAQVQAAKARLSRTVDPKPQWKTVTLSVCWVCGTAMPDDWTRLIHMKRGPYCMRHGEANCNGNRE